MDILEIDKPQEFEDVEILINNKLLIKGVACDEEGRAFGMRFIIPLPEAKNQWIVYRVTNRKIILKDM